MVKDVLKTDSLDNREKDIPRLKWFNQVEEDLEKWVFKGGAKTQRKEKNEDIVQQA